MSRQEDGNYRELSNNGLVLINDLNFSLNVLTKENIFSTKKGKPLS